MDIRAYMVNCIDFTNPPELCWGMVEGEAWRC